MTSFSEADKNYRVAIEASGRRLAKAFASARAVGPIDLANTDITMAVLLRLKSFCSAQEDIKRELQKVYAAPAADFFVETVCFFLKVAFKQLNPSLDIASEKSIIPRRGVLRPDISIWRDNKIVAAIECKTQLGWNRSKWRSDFELRERKLHEQYKNAKLFLLVMTGSNWPGFGKDRRIGKQFFMLLDKVWPNKIDESQVGKSNLVNSIESLFRAIHLHVNERGHR